MVAESSLFDGIIPHGYSKVKTEIKVTSLVHLIRHNWSADDRTIFKFGNPATTNHSSSNNTRIYNSHMVEKIESEARVIVIMLKGQGNKAASYSGLRALRQRLDFGLAHFEVAEAVY